MRKLKIILTNTSLVIVLLISACTFSNENHNSDNRTVIYTAVPLSDSDISLKYPEESKIFAIKTGTADPKLLTESFYSSRGPDISYDGQKMIFSGQKEKGDTWQVWEMELSSSEISQITDRALDCTDPAYLPDGRIVYSSYVKNNQGIDGIIALFRINSDGSNETQITFHPSVDEHATIFSDGRILVNTHQIYPEEKTPYHLILRPDGTKAEMFYKPGLGKKLIDQGWETSDKKFVYVEKQASGGSRIVTVNQNRPYNSAENVSVGYSGDFQSVYPGEPNQYIVSYRIGKEDKFGLYLIQDGSEDMQLILKNDQYNLVEPVIVRTRVLSKRLPSRIVESDDMGTILCMDANINEDNLMSDALTSSVEITGINNSLGRIPVAEDGSFFVKVPSNTALRFQTFDSSGKEINGPSDWIWVRPNERRGCIGCHENKELSPENRVPLAVNKKAVNILEYQKKSNSVKE